MQIILDEIIKSQMRPKMLIVCIAPRDFLDNSHSKISESPIYKHLKSETSYNGINLQNLISKFSLYPRLKIYQTSLTGATAQLLNRSTGLHDAANHKTSAQTSFARRVNNLLALKICNIVPNYDQPLNTLQDLSSYKKVYLPINETTYSQQLKAFTTLLSNAKKHSLKLVIIEMPLTMQNKTLLPKSFWNKYKRDISERCRNFEIEYLDASENTKYEIADFEDSCHLNAVGGSKFFNYLAAVICKGLP
jgi:hypothetical protein